MLKKLLLVIVGLVASIGMAIAAVNINTATEQELDSLPGVGAVRAKAIIDYRKANGNFKSVDDIKNVKGIGDANFEKLKNQIAVSGATTPVAAPPAKADKKEAKAPAKDTAAAKADAKAVAKEVKAEAKPAAKEAKAAVPAAAPAVVVADAKADKAKEKADKKAAAKAEKDAEAVAKPAK